MKSEVKVEEESRLRLPIVHCYAVWWEELHLRNDPIDNIDEYEDWHYLGTLDLLEVWLDDFKTKEEVDWFHAFVVDTESMKVLPSHFLSFETIKEREAALRGASAIEGPTDDQFVLLPVNSWPNMPHNTYLEKLFGGLDGDH